MSDVFKRLRKGLPRQVGVNERIQAWIFRSNPRLPVPANFVISPVTIPDKYMRVFKGLLLLFLISTTAVFAQDKSLSRIRVQGNRFVTAEGKPIVFRGLDTSDPDKLERE